MAPFRGNLLAYTLIPLTIIIAALSFVRFVVLDDYLVSFEGPCDPATESCFIGCEDDECTEEYHYRLVQKYAPDLYSQCGPDITDCEEAYECLSEDGDNCTITYCDPTALNHSCEELEEESTNMLYDM